MAWGTGTWLGQLSLNWTLILVGFTLLVLASLAVAMLAVWDPRRLEPLAGGLARGRNKLGILRWLLIGLVVIAPIWLLQYTAWGVVIHRPYLRIGIWVVTVLVLGMLLTRGEGLIGWQGFVTGLVLSVAAIVMAVPLQSVTDYPFSLGWSEGNRLWDYSVLFGRELYDYTADKPIPVLLDIGRQFVGGLPFLLPQVSIAGVRLWVALTYILPYVILGLAAFTLPGRQVGAWLLAGLWAYTFLNQGPIHPPLVLSAILVALAWRRPLWVAIPLVVVASYFAQVSRWTWMFAPGMWAAMLELAGANTEGGGLGRRDWLRAISVGLAGLFGGVGVPTLIDYFYHDGAINAINTATTLAVVQSETSYQPLLWHRLLPNATYGIGILAGILVAAGPLLLVLIYLSRIKKWHLNLWQMAAVLFPMLAFLVVGIIVSVKIGGGGDLHNLDMLIIGMMFTGAIAYNQVGYDWMFHKSTPESWLKILLILMLGLPAIYPLLNLKPISYADRMGWVMTLRGDHSARMINASVVSNEDAQSALEVLREEIDLAKSQGEILFLDQRQLLTFGYIQDVRLVPEYDKKILINEAMSGEALYFDNFYKELASKRFSLIIANPLLKRIQGETNVFSEENNAWVKWVSRPIRCFYEPKVTLEALSIQLLVPKPYTVDCASKLPYYTGE